MSLRPAILTALVLLWWVPGAPLSTAAESDPVGVWPLVPVPEVVTGFDPPDQPWAAGHRGVDLAAAEGQSVRASLPGTVTYAGRLAGRGVVVVSHGDTRTTYEPVTASVFVGDPVAAGQPVGVLERIGSHCFPQACLHWGWLRGADYLDPLDLVGGGPVRLVPLAGLPEDRATAPGPVAPLTWAPPPLPYAAWLPLLPSLPLLRLLHPGVARSEGPWRMAGRRRIERAAVSALWLFTRGGGPGGTPGAAGRW